MKNKFIPYDMVLTMKRKMNKCIDCKHCKFDGTNISPAGMMIVTNYKCDNPKSHIHEYKMSSIMGSNGNTIDSRENNSCEQFES